MPPSPRAAAPRGPAPRALRAWTLRVSLLAAVAAVASLPAPAAAQAGSPAGPVPVERLRARRAALFARMGAGVGVLRSAEPRSIEGDYPQDSDYREDNDFFYLTGLEAPGSWLVLVARDSGPDEALLYLPPRDSAAERWTGPRLAPDAAARLSGIAEVRAAAAAEGEIEGLALGPGSPARTGALWLRRRERDRALAGRAGRGLIGDLVFSGGPFAAAPRLEDLGAAVAAGRQVKDADELARLRRAIAITAEALRAAMGAAAPGVWEYELEAVIEYTFRRRGAERVGFPSIVAVGPNATTLHYDDGRRRARAGELVVMDVGAEFGYYSADVTRTVPVSGRFTPRQRALYELVLATQQAAIDSVRPGTDLAALNRIARAYLREHSGTLCGTGSCERYFTHGLSHWLGMDVHDVGRFDAPLAPGMVLTVEPGLYLPREGLGIRIEDDVLVTARGHEVLSAAAPRTADEVERAVGRRPAAAAR